MVSECPSKLGNGKNIDWVICDNCQSWYRSICIGLAPTITTSIFHAVVHQRRMMCTYVILHLSYGSLL